MDERQDHMETCSDDDGLWIGGEFFNGEVRRQKRVQTKDNVIYGVFASGDSGSGSKKRRKVLSNKTDYTKPVHFISTDRSSNLNEDDTSSGLIGASSGLGYGSNVVKDWGEANRKVDDVDFLPTSFYRKIVEGAQLRREKNKSMIANKSSLEPDDGVGSFEKHTKRFGTKYFEEHTKGGYKKGVGLGKNNQGIVAPIEAKPRPKRSGLGFNEEATRPAIQEEKDEEKSLPSSTQPRSKEKLLWAKQASQKKKVVYITTAAELLAKKQEQSHQVVQKVLDMRGPQPRVLSILDYLNAEEKARENGVPMPELQHNVSLIVKFAELDFHKLDNDLRNERETVVALHKEKEKLQAEAYHQKKQINSMEEIVGLLGNIEEKSLAGTLTQESLAGSFLDLQTRYVDDYVLYNLASIACSYALPLFIRIFQGWDPLQNPSHGVEVVSLWKKLLLGKDSLNLSDAALPYTQLLMEVVIPAVRISGTDTWDARHPEPMLRFLESWEELLSSPVLQTILDHVVMPKLLVAVDSWDPRRETKAIDSWIHPWLPLFGQKLENCYHTIRYRLESVLHAWQPNDKSAYYLLSPWKSVFDPASWEQLMVRYIIPKLRAVMQDLQINPANQNLYQFDWVRTWVAVIPTQYMLSLMDIFFNKWQEVLYHWLCSNPNFEEVTKWYLGWKELLPVELQANEHVQYRLSIGLDMMNQAVEGLEVVQPGLRENMSYFRVREQREFETQKKAAEQAQQWASASLGNGIQADGVNGGVEMSLKEVFETYAQQSGLLFRPKPGRAQDGHQIYGFGNISITIDSRYQKVYAQNEDRWSLVSLEQLLELQKCSGSRRP